MVSSETVSESHTERQSTASVTTAPAYEGVPLRIRDRIKELRRVAAKHLLANPRNWRRHPKAQARALRDLLVEVGYADALLARELPDGRLMLVDGHLRKDTTPDAVVPVLVLDLDEAEADKLLITLDPLAAMAESDSDRIRTLIENVGTNSDAVKELLRRTAGEQLWTHIHPHEFVEPPAQIDKAGELQRKWATKPGQLWRIGEHRLLCGDSTKSEDVVRLMGEERAVLFATDPPYAVGYTGGSHPQSWGNRGSANRDKDWSGQYLEAKSARHGEGRNTAAPASPLAGKLFDENGEPLYVQGGAKGQRRYRYYVSRKLVRDGSGQAGQGWRVSAPEMEHTVSAAIESILADRNALAQAVEEVGIGSDRLPAVLKSAHGWIKKLGTASEAQSTLAQLADRVELSRDGIRVRLKLPSEEGGDAAESNCIAIANFIPMQMKRRGVETRLVLEGDSGRNRVDLPLLKAVTRARRWCEDLISCRVQSVSELARREGLDRRSVHRLLRLGFLSPRIVEAIAEGGQPAELTVIGLIRRIDLPLLWRRQDQALGLR